MSLGRAAGGRGAPGVAQRPIDARCTVFESAPFLLPSGVPARLVKIQPASSLWQKKPALHY